MDDDTYQTIRRIADEGNRKVSDVVRDAIRGIPGGQLRIPIRVAAGHVRSVVGWGTAGGECEEAAGSAIPSRWNAS